MATSLPFAPARHDDAGDDPRDIYVPSAKLRQVFVPLAKMVSVGIPPSEAIRSLLDAIQDPGLTRVCSEIADRIDRGVSFADACAEFPRVFTPTMVSALQVGMDSGKMGDACHEIAELLEQDARMIANLKKAAIYPVSALVLTVAVLAFMLLFLFPKLGEMYANVPPDELPVLTRSLLALSRVYKENVITYTLGFLAAVGALVAWARSPGGRSAVTNLAMSLPMLRDLGEQFARVRFLSHLARLEKAGKSSAEAAALAADSVAIPHLYERYDTLPRRLGQGLQLSDAMRDTDLFPSAVLTYVRAGERAGSLPDMLAYAAQQEREEASNRLDGIVAFMPSLLIIVVGAVVGTLILGAYGGIFALMKAGQG